LVENNWLVDEVLP